MADDELDLNSLSDEDLVAQMHDDLYDGLKEEIEDSVNILLGRKWTPYDILTQALSFANAVGADAYCRDAAVTVEIAKSLLAKRQGSVHAG
eukprot:gene9531-9607_t